MTGDEVISDSYDMKEIDDTVYEVNCKKIVRGADNFGLLFALLALCSSLRKGGRSNTLP